MCLLYVSQLLTADCCFRNHNGCSTETASPEVKPLLAAVSPVALLSPAQKSTASPAGGTVQTSETGHSGLYMTNGINCWQQWTLTQWVHCRPLRWRESTYVQTVPKESIFNVYIKCQWLIGWSVRRFVHRWTHQPLMYQCHLSFNLLTQRTGLWMEWASSRVLWVPYTQSYDYHCFKNTVF